MSNGKISVTFHDLTVEQANRIVGAYNLCNQTVVSVEPTKEETEKIIKAIAESKPVIVDTEPVPDVVELPIEVDEPEEEPVEVKHVSLDEVRRVMAGRAIENPALKAENKAILAELGLTKLSQATPEQLDIIYAKVN